MDDIFDDTDKTVIRPGMGGAAVSDQTVIRPQPGRRGMAPPVQAADPVNYVQPVAEMPRSTPAFSVSPDVVYQTQTRHINALITCASTVLGVYTRLRSTLSHHDVGGLYKRLVNEIKTFERNAKQQMIKPEIVLAARYILCSIIDEAVLNTPWGSTSEWSQKTLLSTFHNETSGGEKFYLLLDRMREVPAENIEILELMYLCLSLGFEGKYRVYQNGKDQIEMIRDELFNLIRNFRGEYDRELSFGWENKIKNQSTMTDFIPMWVVVSVFAAVMMFSYLGFRVWLYGTSTQVDDKIETMINLINEEQAVDKKARLSAGKLFLKSESRDGVDEKAD